MKEVPLQALLNAMPEGKESRGDSGFPSVDALHKLATLWSQQEIKNLPKFPILNKVFDQATSELNRNNVKDPVVWQKLYDAASTLLPANHAKQQRLESLKKHLGAVPDGTI
jgi:hypothetical protein